MKKVVSVSLGRSERDAKLEIELFGETVQMERRGVDGDIQKAKQLFAELDGQVDVLGVGGIDLWLDIEEKRYQIAAAQKMVRGIEQTVVVDGSGLKNSLERRVVYALIEQIGDQFSTGRVLLTSAVDRFGMAEAFVAQSYDIVFGDLMFVLGLPIPIRSFKQFKRLAHLMTGAVSKLPIKMLYPTGMAQTKIEPRFQNWYDWSTVIAGDCHYIKRHMPDDLSGKTIVTNSTTHKDINLFRQRGVRYLMTTTPIINGRSFGTNLLEAAITAVSGKNRRLTPQELIEKIDQLALSPTVTYL